MPADRWGYFKVPGSWPGITNYMQKDCQTVHAHPSWKDRNLRSITKAWYQRHITVPAEWAGRRVTISAEYLNSYATVHVDGRNIGDIVFPGGELDITAAYRPDGQWEGPVNLTPEFTIDEYRSLAGFSVPPYAPANFVPLAFSDYDEGTVKLLKVPVPLNIREKDK